LPMQIIGGIKMENNKKEIIKCLKSVIKTIETDGADRLIVIIENDKGTNSAWVNIDSYSLGGMFMETSVRMSFVKEENVVDELEESK